MFPRISREFWGFFGLKSFVMFPLPIRPSLYHRWGCLSRGTLCRCSMVFHRGGGECYLSIYVLLYIYYISYIFKHTLPPTDHPSYPYHGVYKGTSHKPMNLKALCPKNAQNSPKHCRKFAENSQEIYLVVLSRHSTVSLLPL